MHKVTLNAATKFRNHFVPRSFFQLNLHLINFISHFSNVALNESTMKEEKKSCETNYIFKNTQNL